MELYGKFVFSPLVKSYKFVVYRVALQEAIPKVVAVHGKHLRGKSNVDVTGLDIENIGICKIPIAIGSFFPNLDSLIIHNCSISSISKFDLMGLPKLKHLSLNRNKISSLPNNLFECSPKLEYISFLANRIELIGRNIFDSLWHLQYINLKMNKNINMGHTTYGSLVLLFPIKKAIASNCQLPKLEYEEIVYSETYHHTFRYFDKTGAFFNRNPSTFSAMPREN